MTVAAVEYRVEDLPPRIAKRITVDPESGCWRWGGEVGRNGYGRTGWQGRRWLTHRLAYVLLAEPIPVDLELDHTCCRPETCHGGGDCPHRRCCNPAHLEAVTRAENLRRAVRLTTHCRNGHRYDGANILIASDGTRRCVECRRAYSAALAERRRSWGVFMDNLVREHERRRGAANDARHPDSPAHSPDATPDSTPTPVGEVGEASGAQVGEG
ncbi:HNH endonuclease family protein [Pseudonocardia charpentierae]|uniref:HNH endonuclease n=1 Tax=Pseudonocardia charpentierae TaxID=3075545 RepID=A0ABU2NJ41_9PSEU|nr:hypothetical protein [Pseudonocardia sp. DSM 45834]MDT0353725.1 hypothetical protein [Pseudonocardia sp. DSM 45834]